MRFKNFINNFSKRNRIFSDEDMYNMSLGNLFDNEDELYSQYQSIGFPNRIELETSPNVQWVKPYTTPQGEQEGGFFQSILEPDYQTPVGSVLQQSLPQIAGFDNKNDIFNLTNILQGQNGIKPDFELGVEKNVFAEPQTNAAQTPTFFPQSVQTAILPAGVQNRNGQNTNLGGLSQDELGKILENMLNIPYLKDGNANQNDIVAENKVSSPIIDGIQGILNQLQDKYKGLNVPETIQKAASKIPIDTVEREYYGLSTKLKDGEMMEDKTIKENNIYSLKDITDPIKSKQYQDYLSKMYNLEPNAPETYEKIKNKRIVVPKETSRLYNYAKNSEALQRWVAKNYERIKNGENPTEEHVEFPENFSDSETRGLFATLHNMDIKNAKVNDDGSLELRGIDPYDFERMEYQNPLKSKNIPEISEKVLKDILASINNNAYGQQEAGQLEKYLLSMPIKLSKKEIEEILKKYGKI